MRLGAQRGTPSAYNPAKSSPNKGNACWLNSDMHTAYLLRNDAVRTWVLDGGLTVVAAVLGTVGVLTTGTCVITWLAVRGSKPKDRVALIKALAQALQAVGIVLADAGRGKRKRCKPQRVCLGLHACQLPGDRGLIRRSGCSHGSCLANHDRPPSIGIESDHREAVVE